MALRQQLHNFLLLDRPSFSAQARTPVVEAAVPATVIAVQSSAGTHTAAVQTVKKPFQTTLACAPVLGFNQVVLPHGNQAVDIEQVLENQCSSSPRLSPSTCTTELQMLTRHTRCKQDKAQAAGHTPFRSALLYKGPASCCTHQPLAKPHKARELCNTSVTHL
jgi:hypothetical protein